MWRLQYKLVNKLILNNRVTKIIPHYSTNVVKYKIFLYLPASHHKSSQMPRSAQELSVITKMNDHEYEVDWFYLCNVIFTMGLNLGTLTHGSEA